jgi:hypothetical protein
MRGKITVIKPGDDLIATTEYEGSVPLEDLQAAVGGYIELVPYWTTHVEDGVPVPCRVFCNENGKIERLPVNRGATLLWRAVAGIVDGGDYLAGPVAIVTGDAEFMADL